MVTDEVKKFELNRNLQRFLKEGDLEMVSRTYEEFAKLSSSEKEASDYKKKAREALEAEARGYIEIGKQMANTEDESKIDPRISFRAGFCYQRAGKLIEAFENYQNAVDKGSKNPALYQHFDEVKVELGRRGMLEDIARKYASKKERESASPKLGGRVAAIFVSVVSLMVGMSISSRSLTGNVIADLSQKGSYLAGMGFILLGLLLGLLLIIKKKQ